jgi:hypothetical protein
LRQTSNWGSADSAIEVKVMKVMDPINCITFAPGGWKLTAQVAGTREDRAGRVGRREVELSAFLKDNRFGYV